MPIYKNAQGWWWGSKGPFETREKALEVMRAALAAGWHEEEESPFSPLHCLHKLK